MTIQIHKDGNIKWNFYRKTYRKARWRKLGKRILDRITKEYPGYYGLIVVV